MSDTPESAESAASAGSVARPEKEDRAIDERRRLLAALGATGSALDALTEYVGLAYPELPEAELAIELPEEPQIPFWRQYAAEALDSGTAKALALRFPQLGFPVAPGMSENEEYRRATRQGDVDPSRRAPLAIEREDLLSLHIEESIAGAVPVLISRNRNDFVLLVRALTARNEPEPVPEAMGACLVKGLVNWDRVGAERRRFEAALELQGRIATAEDWAAEMAGRIRPRKELWQDRLILLSDGPYSAVPAAEVGLDTADWRERSLALRLDHECFHCLTLRRHGLLRSHLLDELLADYVGSIAAFGSYDARRALRFLGLNVDATSLPGGRWEIYRGALPEAAIPALARLVERAAQALERLSAAPLPPGLRARQLLGLAALGLDGIASGVLSAQRTTLPPLCRVGPPTIAAVAGMAGEIEVWARAQGVTERALRDLLVVHDELASNVARHGAGASEMSIEIDLDWTQQRIRYRLEDDAAAFDPGTRYRPDTAAALDTRAPGGLGIHLVRTLAGDIRWSRVGDRNRIELDIALG
ncbi:MAG: ATP-binding protein [Thermoanaerobaculia bacterium]